MRPGSTLLEHPPALAPGREQRTDNTGQGHVLAYEREGGGGEGTAYRMVGQGDTLLSTGAA